MARPLQAARSSIGSYSSVHMGRGYSKPYRNIEITLGERSRWVNNQMQSGEEFKFEFDTIEDARLIANAILAEVRACKRLAE